MIELNKLFYRIVNIKNDMVSKFKTKSYEKHTHKYEIVKLEYYNNLRIFWMASDDLVNLKMILSKKLYEIYVHFKWN